MNGSCSGSWERCTIAELSVSAPPPFGGPAATKPSAMVPLLWAPPRRSRWAAAAAALGSAARARSCEPPRRGRLGGSA